MEGNDLHKAICKHLAGCCGLTVYIFFSFFVGSLWSSFFFFFSLSLNIFTPVWIFSCILVQEHPEVLKTHSFFVHFLKPSCPGKSLATPDCQDWVIYTSEVHFFLSINCLLVKKRWASWCPGIPAIHCAVILNMLAYHCYKP